MPGAAGGSEELVRGEVFGAWVRSGYASEGFESVASPSHSDFALSVRC